MTTDTMHSQATHAQRAFDFNEFRAAVSTSFVPLSVASEKTDPFKGRIRTLEADRLAFSEVTANAHSVTRTPELIAGGGNGFYKANIMLSGTGLLIQDNRELALRPGEIAIYDTGRPYTLVFDDDFRNFIVMIPKELINLPQHLVAELTATADLGDSQIGSLVSQFLVHAPRALRHSFGTVETRIAHSAVDMLETALISTLGTERIEQDPRQVLLRKIREYIEERLGDSDLTLGEIAAAHYISTRHLHGLFHDQGTTVSTYIRVRRLERCRDDLINPVYADRQVSAIAARWGFVDAAHFSRVYRAHYGESPSETRSQVVAR